MEKKLIATVAIAAVCAGVAQAESWTGLGDGLSYENALNWDPSTNAFSGTTRDIDGVFVVNRAVDVTVDRTFVNGGAVLNVTGGTQSDSRSGNTIRNFVGSSGAGTVNMSGGSWNIGHILAVGGNGTGIFNLTGGDLNISRGGNSLAGNPNTFGGSSGGSLSVGYGSGTGLMSISGGSLITRIGVEVGDNGTFQVQGDAATIGIGSSGSLDGHWWQQAGGVLSMGIDDTGVSSLFINDSDSATTDPYAYFQNGALLDLSFSGTTARAGTWTLMELENGAITNEGLAFASSVTDIDDGDGTGWSFAVDNSGVNGLLTATYAIPEPATLGLIGVFGGGLLFVRRRFMM